VFGHLNLSQLNPAALAPQASLAVLAATACALCQPPRRIFRYLTSWPALAALAVIASIDVPMVVIGYLAPCGAMQDTIGAGELLAGRTAYPVEFQSVVRRVLKDNPVPTAPSWLAGIQASHLSCLYQLDLNAHPPLVPVVLAPFVGWIGYFKPILLFEAISLASLVFMIWLWSKAFAIRLARKQWLLFLLVLLGSEPVFEVLRGAGLSGLLAALVVAVWYLMRTERNGSAGVVLGVAAGLKLFPIVAAGAMLFGRMRAVIALALSCGAIVAGIVCLHGAGIFTDYAATAHADAAEYGWFRNNYGLLANIRYFLRGDRTFLVPLLAVLCLAICLISAFVLYRLRHSRAACCDFGMALAATLMCILPPVVWTHYFIILFLPLCVLSYYSKWWDSKWMSVAFFLILAAVDQGGLPLEKLAGILHTEIVWSLPPLAVLCLFGLLCFQGLREASTAVAGGVTISTPQTSSQTLVQAGLSWTSTGKPVRTGFYSRANPNTLRKKLDRIV